MAGFEFADDQRKLDALEESTDCITRYNEHLYNNVINSISDEDGYTFRKKANVLLKYLDRGYLLPVAIQASHINSEQFVGGIKSS